MKKGEMSMTVIIGAAIALLILVVLSVLILRSLGILSPSSTCEFTADNTGQCVSDGYDSCTDALGAGWSFHPASCDERQYCCIPVE